MTSKRISVLLGFILLISCMVGMGVLIFGFGPSFTHGPEESFTDWQAKDYDGSGTRETSGKEGHESKSELAEELERLYLKDSPATSSASAVVPNKKFQNLRIVPSPKSSKIDPTRQPISSEELNRVTENSHVANKPEATQKSDDLMIPKSTTVSSSSTTTILPKLQLRGMVVPTSNNLPPMLPTHPEDIVPVKGDNGSYEDSIESQDAEISDGEDSGLDEVHYIAEAYAEGGATLLELGDLLGLATNLYTSGTNSSVMNTFLRVINETLNQGNSSGILKELNELYSYPEFSSAFGPSDSFVGRNSYETSITAFVFMSFGVFLLNQIHDMINKERHGGESRSFHTGDYLDKSDLNVLFQPPSFNNLSLLESESRSIGDGHHSEDSNMPSLTPNYVNNMFRGFLNLVNAYTKNSQALECIWSLYCEELDQTSAKDGLYGMAARINSIGLRLIMHQIPTELTLDVMLRSLLGWDGLPCKKMFSRCDAEKAASLKAAGSSETHSL